MATKKKLKKLMRSMVAAMPMVMQETHEVHRVTGEVLLEQGHDSNEVQAGKTYSQKMPVLIAFNHEKRLASAYAKNGRTGVTEYIKHVRRIVEANANQKT